MVANAAEGDKVAGTSYSTICDIFRFIEVSLISYDIDTVYASWLSSLSFLFIAKHLWIQEMLLFSMNPLLL